MELKFKAWDKQHKKWVVFEMGWSFDKSLGHLIFHPMPSPEVLEYLDILQYIGKKDKNGVEIYEGDVLRWYPNKPVNHIDVIICWDEHTASFSLGAWYDNEFPDTAIDSLVIGNIYENPELIESHI